MKLSETQMKEFIKGAVEICFQNDRYFLSRFTKKQIAYYSEKSPDDLFRKVPASAGMQLDMITDADEISFDFWITSASSRTFYSIDLYVDGIFCDELYVANVMNKKKGSVCFSLPDGTHHVTVYFPNLMRMEIANVMLTGATTACAAPREKKILFLGDSITQGYDAYRSSLSYANRVARILNAESLNQAIGGEIFDAGILDDKLSFDPDLIIVAYGTNDWWRCESFESFASNAEGFFARLRAIYPEKKIVYISPIWRGDMADSTRVGAFLPAVEALQKIAARYGAHLVDGMRLTPHLSAFFADQFLHPNDLGFSFYAENLVRELEKI